MNKGNHAVNVSAATINQSNEVTSYLQIVPVSIQWLQQATYMLSLTADNGFIHRSKRAREVTGQRHRCDAQHSRHTRNKDLKTEKVPLKIKGLHLKVHSIEAFAHPSIALGKTNYNKLKQNFNHLCVLPDKSLNLMEVGINLCQDGYELQRPLEYKKGTRSEPFAVLT